MPWIKCTRRVRKVVIVVFVVLRWGSPSQQENFSHHHHVAVLTLRSRTHVSAFALVVYWHDPDGTPIQLPGSRAPPRGGAEADFHGALSK